MGPSGSGKTTLGRVVAERLGFPYFDIDDFIWRTDTEEPYTRMYTRAEKIDRLMEAISHNPKFVIAGSMSSFHAEFDPLFEMIVFLTADKDIRIARVQNRAIQRFGARVLEGGDMYLNHMRMIEKISRYDSDGSPSFAEQNAWFESLDCIKLRLDGGNDIETNAARVITAYIEGTS